MITLGKLTDLSVKLQGLQRILVCPLDWGLGHASRCIPIIEAALAQNSMVEVASSGAALHLLRKRFPNLTYHELPTYGIRYPSRFAILNFLLFLPKLLYAIAAEQLFLRKLIRGQSYDLLISDNRLGCWSRRIPSVYMTHQLQFAFRQRWQSVVAARMHAFWYRRFREIWVPDFPPPGNLAGELSQALPGDQVLYLGPLSQFSCLSAKKDGQNAGEYKAMAILSGPEPQRTKLERELLQQFEAMEGPFLLIRGLPKGETPKQYDPITMISFADAATLKTLMDQSQLIICRSGYSSIMDFHYLQKPALLIPTPGQPEQEYLAKWHSTQTQFLIQQQGQLNIKKALLFAKA